MFQLNYDVTTTNFETSPRQLGVCRVTEAVFTRSQLTRTENQRKKINKSKLTSACL